MKSSPRIFTSTLFPSPLNCPVISHFIIFLIPLFPTEFSLCLHVVCRLSNFSQVWWKISSLLNLFANFLLQPSHAYITDLAIKAFISTLNYSQVPLSWAFYRMSTTKTNVMWTFSLFHKAFTTLAPKQVGRKSWEPLISSHHHPNKCRRHTLFIRGNHRNLASAGQARTNGVWIRFRDSRLEHSLCFFKELQTANCFPHHQNTFFNEWALKA